MLSLSILLALVISGKQLDGPSVFTALTLVNYLSVNGLSYSNDGFNAVSNYLSVFKRVESVLLLPEYLPKQIITIDSNKYL